MRLPMTTQGNYPFECGGAQIRAHCRHLATVVTIRGEIDAVNVDRVSKYIRRFIIGTNPVVLDVSHVSGITAAGLSLLHGLDEDCRTAGVEWTLVARPAVVELLGDDRDQEKGAMFPIIGSVHQAPRNLGAGIVRRR